MENPYSLVFGKMPSNYIDCELELNEIIETIQRRNLVFGHMLLQVFVDAEKRLHYHL